jgi:RNA polymerase sigma factor (sigma-70 family)
MGAMSKTNQPMGGVVARIRDLVANSCPETDHELLQQYVAAQDEASFSVLVKRHGPMVLGLCCRFLQHRQDAEDAFQAVFLVLARKAGSIRKSESIASWLHSVAFRIANKLRATRSRRLARETTLVDVPQPDSSLQELHARETLCVLETELNRLADKYRAPLLLCCLQGRTRDEAAQQLGWSVDVLRGRLDRGRELLRNRLTRRGVSLASTLLVLELAETTQAAMLPSLLTSTMRAVMEAAPSSAAAGMVSSQAAALAQGVIQAMFFAKLKWVALSLIAVTFLGTGASVLTYQVQAQDRSRNVIAQKPKQEVDPAQLQREIERLKLELEQARLLLKAANQEILDLRAQAAAGDKAAKDVAAIAAEKERYRAALILAAKAQEEDVQRRQAREELLRAQAELDRQSALLKRYSDDKKASGNRSAVAPDKKSIAIVSDGGIAILDLEGKELRQLRGHADKVTSLVFSPDGKRLASSGKDKAVLLWDVASGKQIAKFTQQAPPDFVIFSPDAKHLMVHAGGQIIEIDIAAAKVIRIYKQEAK